MSEINKTRGRNRDPNTGRFIRGTKSNNKVVGSSATVNKSVKKQEQEKRGKKKSRKGSNGGKSSTNSKKSSRKYVVAEEGGKNLPLTNIQSVETSLKQELNGKRRPYLISIAGQLLTNKANRTKKSTKRKNTNNNKNNIGAVTRGWAIDAPRGSERKELYDACGQKCFLAKPEHGPKGGFKIGFPICRRCVNGKCICAADPRGVNAAYRRAKQWGHTNIATRANTLKSNIASGHVA